MPHISGKHVSKSHSTTIEEAVPIIKSALSNPLIDKVVIGEISSIIHGPRRIKFTLVPAGLKIMIRGINARQLFFIYTEHQDAVKQFLEQAWNKQKY
jgi:hypothetical protein